MQPQQAENFSDYFQKYKEILSAHPSASPTQIDNKIEQQINKGSIDIKEVSETSEKSIRKLSRVIQNKASKFNKELLLLNLSLNRSVYVREDGKGEGEGKRVRSSRSGLKRISKTEVSEEEVEEYRKRRMSSEKRLRQLIKQKQQLMTKRSQTALKKYQRQQKSFEASQLQLQQKLQHERAQKQALISQRLQRLQQSRQSRLDLLKNSYVRSSAKSLPKYKVMRYRFDCKEIQHQVEQKQKFRAMKLRQEYEFTPENIKRHQKVYGEMVKSRRNIVNSRVSQKEQDPQYLVKREAQFNLIRQNPEKNTQKLQQNRLKAKFFEQKLSQIRNIMPKDPQIGKQFQIAKDKSKHPFKYHYLKKKKNISDEEIFQNYSHFNFDSDPTEMGNHYLQEIKSKNKSLGKDSSRRVKTDATAESSEVKIRYKSYLGESRKCAKKKKEDQIEQLMKKYGSKSKVIQILQSKAQVHTVNTLKKIQKLKTIGSYTNTLQIQKQIDEQFVNSIKAKLKCFQVK